MTTLEAIYENGIFKPVSGVPGTLREHARVRITIDTDDETSLRKEFSDWEAASDEDLADFEKSLGENS
ncbi:MAG: antitoxin AF2212-like protein [Pyrinomonadaceae bacterium]